MQSYGVHEVEVEEMERYFTPASRRSVSPQARPQRRRNDEFHEGRCVIRDKAQGRSQAVNIIKAPLYIRACEEEEDEWSQEDDVDVTSNSKEGGYRQGVVIRAYDSSSSDENESEDSMMIGQVPEGYFKDLTPREVHQVRELKIFYVPPKAEKVQGRIVIHKGILFYKSGDIYPSASRVDSNEWKKCLIEEEDDYEQIEVMGYYNKELIPLFQKTRCLDPIARSKAKMFQELWNGKSKLVKGVDGKLKCTKGLGFHIPPEEAWMVQIAECQVVEIEEKINEDEKNKLIDELLKKVEESENDMEVLRQKHEETLEKEKEDWQTMEKLYQIKKEEVESLQQEKEIDEWAISTLKHRREELEREVKHCQREWEKDRQRKDGFYKELQNSRREKEVLQRKLEEERQKVVTLQRENKESKQKLTMLLGENEDYQREVFMLRQEQQRVPRPNPYPRGPAPFLKNREGRGELLGTAGRREVTNDAHDAMDTARKRGTAMSNEPTGYLPLIVRKSRPYSFKKNKVWELVPFAVRLGLSMRIVEKRSCPYSKIGFCAYHEKEGHALEECFTFKDWIEDHYQAGVLHLPKHVLQRPSPHE